MQTTKTLKYWQWRTIIVTMIGYAMFYLVRKNFSFSMPGLGAEFGITKTQLGLFLTLHGVIYGLSRYVVGIIPDRNSARKVRSLGLMLCAIVNILVGTSDAVAGWIVALAGRAGDGAAIASVLVYVMGVLWMVNGFLQGMGVPPCTKTLTQWIHPKELATKMSFWNMSHGGSGFYYRQSQSGHGRSCECAEGGIICRSLRGVALVLPYSRCSCCFRLRMALLYNEGFPFRRGAARGCRKEKSHCHYSRGGCRW